MASWWLAVGVGAGVVIKCEVSFVELNGSGPDPCSPDNRRGNDHSFRKWTPPPHRRDYDEEKGEGKLLDFTDSDRMRSVSIELRIKSLSVKSFMVRGWAAVSITV